MTKHQLDQLRYGLSPTEIESLTKNRGGERRKRVSRTFPTSLCEGCAPEAAERSPPPVHCSTEDLSLSEKKSAHAAECPVLVLVCRSSPQNDSTLAVSSIGIRVTAIDIKVHNILPIRSEQIYPDRQPSSNLFDARLSVSMGR